MVFQWGSTKIEGMLCNQIIDLNGVSHPITDRTGFEGIYNEQDVIQAMFFRDYMGFHGDMIGISWVLDHWTYPGDVMTVNFMVMVFGW